MFNMAEVIVPVQFIKICNYCKAELDSQKKLEDHHSVFHDDGCYYSSQEEDGCSTSEEEDSVANVSDVFVDDDRDADFDPDDEVVKRKRKFNSKLRKKAKKGKSVHAKSSKDAEMTIDNKEKDATKGRKTRKARKDHQMSKRSKNVS